MFFGHDQHMRGCLRRDVFESEDEVVFIDLFRWDLARDNAAEEAIGGFSHGFPVSLGTQVWSSGGWLDSRRNRALKPIQDGGLTRP
jgi:hypothetical protein